MHCALQHTEKQYHPRGQVLDVVNKCIYLQLHCGVYLPVEPSGGVVSLPVLPSITPTLNYAESIKCAQKVAPVTSIHPVGILYENEKHNNVSVIGVITETLLESQSTTMALIPVTPETTTLVKLQQSAKELSGKKKLFVDKKSIYKYQLIDNEILNKPKHASIDRRILQVNEKAYQSESYQMFRLECSDILDLHDRYKQYIRKINNDPRTDNKKYLIRKILYKALNAKLYEIYTKLFKDSGNIKLNNLNSFHIISNDEYKNMDFSNYVLKNIRTVCRKYTNKPSCSASLHCRYVNGKCKFSITQDMFIEFVNRITEEILQKGIMYYEIMKESVYRVSDIINTNVYTVRDKQLIIETTNDKTQKLAEIYGDSAPIIGRRRVRKILVDNIDEEYVPKGSYALQRIVPGDNTIFRTVANCLYWLQHSMYHPSDRNLGHVSTVQTDYSNFLKKQFIEYINRKSTAALYGAVQAVYDINKSKFKTVLKNKVHTFSDNRYHLIELYVLHVIYSVPIVVCYDVEKIEYVIDNDTIYDKKTYPPRFNDPAVRVKSINIKLEFLHNYETPMNVYAMLF